MGGASASVIDAAAGGAIATEVIDTKVTVIACTASDGIDASVESCRAARLRVCLSKMELNS